MQLSELRCTEPTPPSPLLPIQPLFTAAEPALPLAPLVKGEAHLPTLARVAPTPLHKLSDLLLHTFVHGGVTAADLQWEHSSV
jgi:hypothetical protein